MYVKCVSPFGEYAVGDVIEVPDGSAVALPWFVVVDEPAGLGGTGEPITPPVS